MIVLEVVQSGRETDVGFAVRVEEEAQDPAPAPVVATAMDAFEPMLSEITTDPPELDVDPDVRLIVTVLLPDNVASIPDGELETKYGAEPPEIETCCEVEQSLTVIAEGLTASAVDGQAPNARPTRVRVTVFAVIPSEIPILTETSLVPTGPEGFNRRTETVLPEINARTLPLPEVGCK